ncbi:hypothetical protein MBLNU230_g7754t1 [Neophaeotheca triangularis]
MLPTVLSFFLLAFVPLIQGKSLWSTTPANYSDIIRTAYTVGNGRLAALPFGEAGHEKLNLNVDSLWTGGPFENSSYNGGNPTEPVYDALPGIRDWIFRNGTGNVSALMGPNDNYGSYAVLANLSVSIAGVDEVEQYKRSLDLKTGVHTTTFEAEEAEFTISTYCTYPDQVCVYDVLSTQSLPEIEVYMENVLSNASLISATCDKNHVRLTGRTRADTGMSYDSIARVSGRDARSHCRDGILTVPGSARKRITLVVAAGTDYDASRGNAQHSYSFKGAEPGPEVERTVSKAARKHPDHLIKAHMEDYAALAGAFTLELPDPLGSADIETSEIIARYSANSTAGDPYLEGLAFDYGRPLFIGSSRDNSLPPNLQGKWAYGLENAWGADYHANINLQMNHWPADQTGLGDLQSALWSYMEDTWVPRGTETARLLYNASGWVTHNEMNTFGHTGMKTGEAYWANYPASAAWMMEHVWDYYDYSRDLNWLVETGYPLLKGVAKFWLTQLQQDLYFNDGTLVVNPCDSPEHGGTTFACSHYQQLLHQLLTTTLQSAILTHDPDTTFTSTLHTTLQSLDTGLHIEPKTNTLMEWKLPSLNSQYTNSTHRHLSHLNGWYPGFSLSAHHSGYTNTSIASAVRNSLIARGPGIEDANAGWEKVWRAACWARLNDTTQAHFQLRLALQENWAPNALAMYSGEYEPFQIDANFGYVGAVLAMLVVDLPGGLGERAEDGARTVVLGPAIPGSWEGGCVRGLRVRGGGVVDFGWDGEGLVRWVEVMRRGMEEVRFVDREGRVLCDGGWGCSLRRMS